ncbi:hypothetical protein FACS1894211_05690 [Clostridia bacterium]|nr:hypothetical protein FACS1894211_05690 [Clostridia bacterium]
MRIVVINGAKNKGCTYKMKDLFLEALGGGHEITEYHLPDDAPVFCTGCKACCDGESRNRRTTAVGKRTVG